MMRTRAALVVFGLCWGFLSTAAAEDRIAELMKDPGHRLKSYNVNFNSPLSSRIKYCPDFVIAFLKKYDNRTNYRPFFPEAKQLKELQSVIEKLPGSYKKILKEKLVGIYFIDNFLGSGLTDWVFDDNRNGYIYIAFNSSVVNKDISSFLTAKENTCFIPDDSETSVEIDCGSELPGFTCILLHETSHVVDHFLKITPYVDPVLINEAPAGKKQAKKTESTEFTRGIWSDYDKPEIAARFTGRDKITFYGLSNGPKIKMGSALEVYGELLKSPFASLYGSLSWAEDFAEMASFYCITGRFKQPYRIIVKDKNGEHTFEPLASETVQKRLELIKNIID